MNIKAQIKKFLSQRRRKMYLSLVIHSNLVNGYTEASTAIRMAEEFAKYVEKGEYKHNTLPNGYRWEE
ncbi:hypothetical protein [uncultured Bacteroides sp.]|jgi:hypothetical protein|uniref:hypothetical protein n=1 Tax=uncultured Bacteroides sp. TaxID=162156 RepID=UPI00280AF5E8|nr:hypothetical protein [uncultured Bacteroides sp.]